MLSGVGPGKSQVCGWEEASGGVWRPKAEPTAQGYVTLGGSLSLWTFLSLPVKMEGLEFAGKPLLYLRHFFIGPWSLDSREAPLTDKVPGPSLC